MPRISVITICYNDKAGLGKTLASVFKQRYDDFEYVVIDGGSADGSAELVKANADRFAYWISEKDKGIYDAQNKGWRHAKGEYCLFLNSGDYLADENVLSRFATHLNTDIVCGDLLVDNGKDPLYRLGQQESYSFEDLVYSTVFHPAAFIRRSLLDARGGYDESFRIVADYDFFVDCLLVKKVSYSWQPVAVSVFNTAGVGSDPANKKKHDEERKRALLKYFPADRIEEAERNVQKRKPRSVRLQESVSGIPVLREITQFGLLMYNRIRKTGA